MITLLPAVAAGRVVTSDSPTNDGSVYVAHAALDRPTAPSPDR